MTNYTHKLTKHPDKSFTLELTIPKDQIQHEYEHMMGHALEQVKIDGFRPGKAPKELAEKQINTQTVLEETFKTLVSEAYRDIIVESKLQPILDPKVNIKEDKLTQDADWVITMEACERPEAVLAKDYLDQIKKANEKIKKDQPMPDTKAQTDEVLNVLAKLTKLTLPPVLVDADVQNKLVSLVDQAMQLGVTVQQYLESKKVTLDEYKKQLATQIQQEWELNLALDVVANDAKLAVKPEEIQDTIAKSKQTNLNPNLVGYILRQQKSIDYLLTV